jgi:hypothetical protein
VEYNTNTKQNEYTALCGAVQCRKREIYSEFFAGME